MNDAIIIISNEFTFFSQLSFSMSRRNFIQNLSPASSPSVIVCMRLCTMVAQHLDL